MHNDTISSTVEIRQFTLPSIHGADGGSKNAVAILIGPEVGKIESIKSTSPASCTRMSLYRNDRVEVCLNLLLQLPLSGFEQPVDSGFSCSATAAFQDDSNTRDMPK